MSETASLIKELLKEGYLLSLASIDASGPWVSDVIYIADNEFSLYFISRIEFRHSKAFLKNQQAAGAITVREKPEGQSTGLQLAGTVRVVNSIPAPALRAYTRKRNGSSALWQLAEGEAWYKFTPSTIDLIYEPLFGYTKKTITLPAK